MASKINSLGYLQSAVETILSRRGFDDSGHAFTGGLSSEYPLRPTQKGAFEAYRDFLRDDTPTEHKKSGYFEIPTGVGKTGVFVGLVNEALKAAKADGQKMHAVIVVPTTNLLKQTRKDIFKFAPELADHVGLYGDGHKSLHKPVTVMTYDSWIALTEEGKLNHKNVDLLISDEAHRGTSERRVDQMFAAYGNGTIQLAFTATAHFDEEKSVEQTHKNQIFYKSLPDAVKGGELADYIHSQLFVIRVKPLELTDEFKAAVANTPWKSDMKQRAWTQRITQIYAHGVDHVTGDRLSDNQAGFFVGDIAHAEDTAKSLNADPALIEKVKAQGRKVVAVAIHSKMPPNEQKKRLDAVLAGEYLCLVGDEKFKEGFDHPPLKVICDYPRGSIVDKAQIAGRAARKWWNDDKGRWEGMTFIDTVVYIGNEDSERDETARKSALRSAVLVSSILEGTEIFAKASKNDPANTTSVPSAPRQKLKLDGVEEYSDLQSIKTIHAEIAQIKREGFINLTPEHLEQLESEITRTGIGAGALITHLGDDCPDGLTAGMIDNGWRKKASKTADPNHWATVMSAYKSLPEIKNITQADIDQLEAEITRTGKGALALVTHLGDQCPKWLTKGVIDSWRKKHSTTTNPNHWGFLMDAYKALPTVQKKARMVIVQEHLDQLKAEITRTGKGGLAIISHLGDQCPDWLTTGTIKTLLSRATKTLEPEYWEGLIDIYKKLPDVKKITQPDRDQLEDEIARTGKGPAAIFTYMGNDAPEGLSHQIIDRWRRPIDIICNPAHWVATLTAYQSLPTIKQITKIEITQYHRDQLEAEITRTGKGPTAILKAIGNNAPEGLSYRMIDGWRNGKSKTADPDHWHGLMTGLAMLPTIEQKEKLELTDVHRASLETQIRRTGKGPTAILTAMGDEVPQGLTADIIKNWRIGAAKTADPDQWNVLMASFAALVTLNNDQTLVYQKLKQVTNLDIHGAFSEAGKPIPPRLSLRGALTGFFEGKAAIHKDDLAAIDEAYAIVLQQQGGTEPA